MNELFLKDPTRVNNQIKSRQRPLSLCVKSIYRVFSCPYFPIIGLNTEKHRPEKTLHLVTFHAV